LLEKIQGTDLANGFYNAFFVIGLLTAFAFGIWYRKRFNISVWKATLLVAMFFVALLAWTFVHFQIESGFTGIGTKSVVRAMPYLMLIIWPISALLKLKWAKACDFFAPLVCLYLGIAQIGCVFAGCCEGYPCKWGIYNYRYDGLAFPIQVVELISVLALFFVMLQYNKKHNYQSGGKAVPIMLIIFGAMRFLWEFARNNKKIFMGCSAISFHALFMVLVGIETFFTIQDMTRKKKEKIERNLHNSHNRRRGKK
jgi:hypothetical protein